ncbi:TonB-dependent receptor [bacterium]|nr:TonB-dependent receptor [bacterium]
MFHSKILCLLLSSMILAHLVGFYALSWAGTTGKIVGYVTDADSGEPLPGANVIIEGTTMGAATDLEGYYIILNVPPGVYTLVASMIGYQRMRIENVRVSINFTSKVNFQLKSTVLEVSEEITVVAERPVIRKDLTSTLSTVSGNDIAQMPVEKFEEVLELQAGVIQGSGGEIHVRGGRASEVAYMVDGVSVTDPFSGNMAVTIENNAIQELQVVSGTFNAEYGQAMSGVVDIVTKEGSEKYSGQLSAYIGDYVSSHKETFLNIDYLEPLSVCDIQGTVSGPIPHIQNKLHFFLSGRFYDNEGWLYGKRIFNPSDSSNFDDPNPNNWYIEKTGDGAIVPMNPEKRFSYQGKLTFRISPSIKLTGSILGSRDNFKVYDHLFKYNPDGSYQYHKRSCAYIVTWSHAISPRTFYTIKVSNFFTDHRSYVYKNPYDPRYVDPRRLFRQGAFSFHTGGTAMWHNYRNTTTYTARFDITSQVTKTHQIKTGFEFQWHKLYLHEFELIMNQETHWRPAINPLSSPNHNQYTHYPVAFSCYIQDKMEFKDMIVNAGLRYDYFNSRGKVPLDPRDPNNSYLKKKVWYKNASPKHQVSPRIGIAYPITDRGVIHFSYGHFFQIPPFKYLYHNSEFEVIGGGLKSRMGNADLKPQKTVIYEIGLQQQLTEDIGIDVTGFYKDIRGLVGTEIYELYVLGDRYARYINRDYGNVRGFTIALDKRHGGLLSASVDYTYQVAEGNASDPNAQFYDRQSEPPRESEIQVVPLDWDQTHTLNFTVTLSQPNSWGISIIGRFGSGLPYTPEVQHLRTSFENSERKPPQYTFDLRTYREFRWRNLKYSIFLKVSNLFDQKNENQVYLDTGRAGYTLVSRYAGDVQGVNTLEDFLNRPDFYSEPRRVVVGITIGF